MWSAQDRGAENRDADWKAKEHTLYVTEPDVMGSLPYCRRAGSEKVFVFESAQDRGAEKQG